MSGSVSRGRAETAPTTRVGRRSIAVLMFAAVIAAAAGVEAASLPLTWNAPTTNADGSALRDLAGYRIYLGTSAPACPSASFHAVPSPTATPASGDTVSTRITGLTGGTMYFARVTAIDSSGNESGCTGSVSGVAQADFTVSPTGTTNFGSVAVNGTVDRNFTVQNTSTGTMSVTVSVGAPFSVVSGSSFSLAGGGSRDVTVRFRPTSTGSFAGNATFTTGSEPVSRSVTGSTSTTAPVTLTVAKNGSGSGTVSSSPAGIACGTDCAEALTTGTRVTLTATAATGSVFAGWSGACTGTAATCSWTMGGAASVTATFNTSGTPSTPSGGVTPATPGSPTVTTRTVDATGVTFDVAWPAAGGATSYRYAAAFNDGSGAQQGSVTGLLSAQLRMPYHRSGAAFGAFVCIRAVGSTGLQSPDQACAGMSVAAGQAVPPAPQIGGLAPSGAAAGSAGFTLTVTGSGFTASSVARWNGSARPTTVVSATQLLAAISAADIATSGTASVSVFTPAPGGGTSGSRTFTITASSSPSSPTSSTPPAMPSSPNVRLSGVNGTGATFNVTWGAVSGATSYAYFAAFSDGSALQQGSVGGPALTLTMPYHRTGGAFGAFICVRSVNASGVKSADQACAPISVPGR